MIRMEDINPGSKVSVELPVVEKHVDGERLLVGFEFGTAWVSIKHVVAHTPKPREFKVGDRVTWGGGSQSFEICGLHNDIAWLPGFFRDAVKHTRELRHVD